jgi:uncharacterized protein YbjT (DUF2867 family)
MSTTLITGATGYIGGRLAPKLIDHGYKIRVMARNPARLLHRSWASKAEVVQGDVFDTDRLMTVLDGIESAYYLIHSMDGRGDFHRRDMQAAQQFGQAAGKAGVKRIIYLGGLGDPKADLSQHLRSRQEVGEALGAAGVPVTEFRAAIIVGSGSISFEMVRYLTERIPIMICPSWVFTRVQPIAVDDVLEYLSQSLRVEETSGRVIEIGGADVLTYGDMMLGYARARDLKRYLIPVPVLTPRLSSYWVHWMTPVPASITRPLVEGLRNEVVVRDDSARQLFPEIKPVDFQTAVHRALTNLDASQVETRWTDALVSSMGAEPAVELIDREGMITEIRRLPVDAEAAQIFATVASLGGDRGWLYMNWSWELRGLIDRLFGGVGLRRGRRHPSQVRVGDAIDFWRVEKVEPEKQLLLRAEMKLPGKAWLEYRIDHHADETTITQTAYFAPRGLSGLLYWYVLYPIHSLIFSGLIKQIKSLSETR